jgi:hypothetical protein
VGQTVAHGGNPSRRQVAAWLAAGVAAPVLARGRSGAPARKAQDVSVTLTGTARTVTPMLLGLNGSNTTGPLWNNAKFDAVLETFGPGMIRYPGGTAANYWDWTAGWFQPGGGWPGEPAKAIDDTIAVFSAALDAAGAAPLWDLNTVTCDGAIGTAAQNADMLAAAVQALQSVSSAGLAVPMLELGNELYLNGYTNTPPGPHDQDYAQRFPTAADYATQMNPWIATLHSTFPGVKIAAVGADTEYVAGGLSQRRKTWNAGVLPILTGQDAMTLHENLRVFDTADGPAAVLSTPWVHYQALAAGELALFASYDLPVWVTEFNMKDESAGKIYQGTWLHGLFVAAEALIFTANPAIEYAGLNATVGNAQISPIFDNAKGFGSGGPPTVPLALSAAGTTLSIIQAAFSRGTASQPLAFSPNATLTSAGAPSLLGSALTTGAGTELLLLNLSSSAQTVDLSVFFPAGYTATQITCAATTTKVTGPSSVLTSTAAGSGGIALGPYTLADVTG